MKKEQILNTFMIFIVILVAGGSGIMVYKNLLDKEVREKQEMIQKQEKEAEMRKEGFIMLGQTMYQTKGDTVFLMTKNVSLPTGVKVYINGHVIMQDGSNVYLTNNQMLNLKGEVVKNSRIISITPSMVTPTVMMKK